MSLVKMMTKSRTRRERTIFLWLWLPVMLLLLATRTVKCSEISLQDQISNNSSQPFFVTNNFTAEDSAFPDEIESSPFNEPNDDQSHGIVAKPVKKKSYRILQKPGDVEDHLPYKEFDAHSEAFDFNLDDLEDIHQSFKSGDLNSEEVHLLRDASKLRYEEISSIDNSTGPTFIESSSSSSSQKYQSTESETPSSTNRNPIDVDGTTTTTRHVFKIAKSGKFKVKSHDLLKKEDSQKGLGTMINSISDLLEDQTNATDVGTSSENFFQLLVNLYDHFYWQPAEIRTEVTPACGVELLAYLAALSNNFEWAQRAYDSSGRYRGQFHYGNDLWLGQKMFCHEVNFLNEQQTDRKRFQVAFFVVRVAVRMPPATNLTKVLQIGECLPKSCTPKDIEAVMELDPHARIFAAQNSTRAPLIQVLGVRRVPSGYQIWQDPKFQIFGGVCVGLAAIILIATVFEANLTRAGPPAEKQPVAATPTSTRVDSSGGGGDTDKTKISAENANGKEFELYQMNVTAAENNNVDVEGNFKYKKAEHARNGNVAPVANGNLSQKKEIGFHHKLLLCFALGSNASAILSIEKSHEDAISCVHGIRVFSLLWTIMVHTYLQLFTIGENQYRRKVSERTFTYQVIGNATFSVDSFFFISGLLVTLLFLRHHKVKGNSTREFVLKGATQTAVMVIYRYIRLTPAYVFVIVFNQLALTYIFDGSVFQPTVGDHLTCAAFWWRNILYVNNWYPLRELCMIWSWYLANDMQFYIMAVVLLVISTRNFKFSFLTILFFLVTSWGTAGVFSLHHHYTHKVAEPFESFDFLYDKPWQRIGTYIVGMITGHIIHRVRTPPKVPLLVNLLLWLASVGLLFILIFGVWDGSLGVLASAFYVSIGHTAWGLGLVWITLSCCWGLSSPINQILSYRGFLPLSRLTYCTYLVHPVLMLITSFQMEGPIHLEHSMVLTVFLGNAVLSFMIAFLISVSFEAPVIRLLKIFFRK